MGSSGQASSADLVAAGLRRQLTEARAALGQAASELFDQRQRTGELERELSRVTAVLARSQRASELDSLLADNERLHCRAVSAEDDFRDQYDALMTEFAALLTENERLQAQLEAYRAGGAEAGGTSERDFWQQRAESLQAELSQLKSERQHQRQESDRQLAEANARLSERAQLFEAANSAMADELAQKAALIDRCLPDCGEAAGGAPSAHVGRSLRDIAEELALKNIHLEDAVERLALELQALKAPSASAPASSASALQLPPPPPLVE